jgi:hypothetical protein
MTERQPLARSPFACRWWLRERRPLGERAVRPVLVVMADVGAHNLFKVAATEVQQPVKTFAA